MRLAEYDVNAKHRGYICFECARARGGVWPDGHVATISTGECPACKRKVSLASVGDYDWPKGSQRPSVSGGRD